MHQSLAFISGGDNDMELGTDGQWRKQGASSSSALPSPPPPPPASSAPPLEVLYGSPTRLRSAAPSESSSVQFSAITHRLVEELQLRQQLALQQQQMMQTEQRQQNDELAWQQQILLAQQQHQSQELAQALQSQQQRQSQELAQALHMMSEAQQTLGDDVPPVPAELLQVRIELQNQEQLAYQQQCTLPRVAAAMEAQQQHMQTMSQQVSGHQKLMTELHDRVAEAPVAVAKLRQEFHAVQATDRNTALQQLTTAMQVQQTTMHEMCAKLEASVGQRNVQQQGTLNSMCEKLESSVENHFEATRTQQLQWEEKMYHMVAAITDMLSVAHLRETPQPGSFPSGNVASPSFPSGNVASPSFASGNVPPPSFPSGNVPPPGFPFGNAPPPGGFPGLFSFRPEPDGPPEDDKPPGLGKKPPPPPPPSDPDGSPGGGGPPDGGRKGDGEGEQSRPAKGAKERDKIELPAYPTAAMFSDWLLASVAEISAASGQGRLIMPWLNGTWTLALEELMAVSPGKESFEAKLLQAVRKCATANAILTAAINFMSQETMKATGELPSGRAALRLLSDGFVPDKKKARQQCLEDLEILQMHGIRDLASWAA
ncbi:unnamed protein product [Polarella glacialis]|uniref:Uncharacterized protein n=1 Tax=Polarella glacialis TaxID=89957 RepID=A0A813DC80_POLGL|nr:unnamed protein product [Polarella glacialis]CAE8662067.1 unnamed protein product [Polarella glacialis]